MTPAKLLRPALLAICVGLLAVSVGGANAALVKVGSLVLTADGGFQPQTLPANGFAPIDFKGHADVRDTKGGSPPPLEEALIDFDREGRVDTRGLPVCRLGQVAHATTDGARSKCRGALVGTATVGAIFDLAGIPIQARIPASLFNGPRRGGHINLIGHAYAGFPIGRTFAVEIPLEKRRGPYSYRARFDIPKFAGGVFTHLDGKIGRRYEYKGKEHSFMSARCRTGVIHTHGRFIFADAERTIIDGQIEKPCFPEP